MIMISLFKRVYIETSKLNFVIIMQFLYTYTFYNLRNARIISNGRVDGTAKVANLYSLPDRYLKLLYYYRFFFFRTYSLRNTDKPPNEGMSLKCFLVLEFP